MFKKIFLAIIAVLLFAFLFDQIWNGAREKYCLKKTLAVYGLEAPMKDAKWEYFTNCYDETLIPSLESHNIDTSASSV